MIWKGIEEGKKMLKIIINWDENSSILLKKILFLKKIKKNK